MAVFFFDTSGLAKRYIYETGSTWVTNVCLPASRNLVYIAEITAVEMVSAITRRARSGSLTTAHAAAALARFEADLLKEYFVLEIASRLLTGARDFAGMYGLRGYDAVQLAVAVNFNREQLAAGLPTITLVSADTELLEATRAESLLIENPNHHP